MRLMPKSLYGQFSSANAMLSPLGRHPGGICWSACAWMASGGSTRRRGLRLSLGLRLAVGLRHRHAVFLCLGYREWKRLGGDDNYRPPAPWKPEGFEEVADKVKSVPAKPRAVMLSMWLGVGRHASSTSCWCWCFMYFMHQHEMSRSLLWYAWYFIPIKLVLTGLAYVQLVQVRGDIAAQERGESTRFGVPHHGVMLVNAIQGLVYFPVYWYQMVKVIELG